MSTNYEPYKQNSEGLVGALIDLKDTLSGRTVYSVAGFGSVAFEDVSQGDAVYARSSDGKVGKASNNGTLDQATCVGFVQTSKSAGEDVRVLITGILAKNGLDAGDVYFLGVNGGIVSTPPTAAGDYVVKLGEAINTTNLAIHIGTPILLT